MTASWKAWWKTKKTKTNNLELDQKTMHPKRFCVHFNVPAERFLKEKINEEI